MVGPRYRRIPHGPREPREPPSARRIRLSGHIEMYGVIDGRISEPRGLNCDHPTPLCGVLVEV